MRSDYRIGNWIIRPRRGCIERGEETVHVNPRPLAVLKCLADAGGEVVTRDELFDAVWPGVIVTDDALTQCVVELRKAFGDSASDPQFIRTVPKVGFCLVAPVGPLTDESDDKPEPAGKAGPPGSRKWASLLIVGIVVLALALFWYLAGPGSMEERVPVEEIPSVAVLPFVNMSADEENDYLCRGVSETILNMLAQTPDLHVASGTSSFQPRLKGLSLPEIADLLGVTTVLEGSVQRQGNRLRITAQLIDAENDAHLWSRNFDRDDTDVFAIQDEIAAAVTSALRIAVRDNVGQRIDSEGTDNAEAYDEYMQAQSLVDAGNAPEAVKHVERAIELDPDYARAYVLLGRLFNYVGTWPELNVKELLVRARETAKKAVELAPDMPAALVLLATWTKDPAAKGQLLRRAYENGPNDVDAILAYAHYHVFYDPNPAESEALARKALALDPLREETYWNLTFHRLGPKQLDKAFEIIALWKKKFPESTWALLMEALVHWLRGDYRSTIATHLEALELEPWNLRLRTRIGGAYLEAGMPEEAQQWIDSVPDSPPPGEDWFYRVAGAMMNIYYQRHDAEVFTESRQLLLEGVGIDDNLELGVLTWFVEYGKRLGRLDEVLATFEQLYPHLFAEPPHDLENDKDVLFATAFALLQHGDAARGEPLMRAYLEIQDRAEEVREGVVFPWSIHGRLALGEREAALDKFRTFATLKWYWANNTTQWMFRHSSLYDPIRDEPEFIALLDLYEQNAAEQRRLLQEADFPIPAE